MSVKEEICGRDENYETLLSIIKQKKMKWFGYVSRHPKEHNLANTYMHGRVPGKRGRGRPIYNWLLNISNWGTMNLYDATKSTAERNMRRGLVISQKLHLID